MGKFKVSQGQFKRLNPGGGQGPSGPSGPGGANNIDISIDPSDGGEIIEVDPDLNPPIDVLPQPLDQHIRGDEAAEAAKEQGADPANMSESELQREIQQAAQAAQKRGVQAGNSLRTITGQQEAKIDWRAIIRKYMSQATSRMKQGSLWDRPSRLSQAIGVYMPQKIDKPIPGVELIAAVDVSGSVSPDDFNKFYAELQKLARTFKQPVEVLYWDVSVESSEIIDARGNPGPKGAVRGGVVGGGGTEITSVKRYLEKEKRKPRLVVYLTDGWIEDTPDFIPRAQRLFVITHNGSEEILKNHGETVKMLN